MRIVVVGGTRLIGSKLVTKLIEQGHEAVAASPSLGVNTITGEGLAGTLHGTSVVVDDRIAMLKYGMPDLRVFFAGDLRWLNHYGFPPLAIPTLAAGLS